ncbi:SpoIIE family protein phosphatase [Yinghuangia sp. YIM S10712]|uniref:SpoIIE family protein phosphatase n=1 Tax=Yinghuangia sp. YIM S10712 TaxID=3436930 RepID=UPI003F538916
MREVVPVSVGWDDIDGLVAAHERFVAGARVETDVRSSVLDSWKRCRSAGLEPGRLSNPYAADLDLDDRFRRAADPVLGELNASLADTSVTVVLCDAQGRMVQRHGGTRKLLRRLDDVQFAPGFDVSEQAVGTNGVGTALAGRKPVFLVGREHFADCLQPFACAGAPVRNPLSGHIEAVLDLTCLRGEADPAMLRLVREAARSIESRLLDQATERERALLTAYRRAVRMAGGRETDGHEGGAGLGRSDLAVLREKAEELIASPQRNLEEVPLSGGRMATLLRHLVTGAAGETGVVVEARLFGVPGVTRMSLTEPPAVTEAAPTAIRPPILRTSVPLLTKAAALAPSEPQPQVAAGDADTDGWPLLVGEPGVGRLALLARRRLELLHDAGVRIGSTLDVACTAEELGEVTVPRFADFAAVDLPDAVLAGEEPGPFPADTPLRLRRVAFAAVHGQSRLPGAGDPVRYMPSSPQARSLSTGQSVVEPAASNRLARHPAAERAHSLITVPLRARGATLGVVSFHRSERPAPFEEDDLSLAQELAARAAICIDNARRYTREHQTALALQRSLLPRGRPEQSAVEVAYRYLPAQAGVGGDWFDVIPLSGARVALVVGDVVGHGLHAAATMGRLRTAVHNFCSLDLSPDDLLTRLDDLVGRLDRGEGWAVENTHQDSGIIGATCLFAVYDPTSRRCTLTRAGHPMPAVVGPDGAVAFVDLPAGPPLGLGGLPFETVEMELAEGSQLVLYTDGLIEHRTRDLDTGLERLRTVLAHADRSPEDTCEAVLDAMLPTQPSDDVALLVVRTHALAPEQVAHWDLPGDPAVVSHARAVVGGQLAAWGLDALAVTTELVASELVTNAIRHATGPIRLRLIRDRALICEISDGSSTSPRLRRARNEDEGGRGLFLVSQLTDRWGTRYTSDGKVIWTEQRLP